MDTKKRSIVKSVTWRVIGVIILGVIAFVITGNWKQMTIITVVFHSIRLVLYYYHERLWEHLAWGKIRHPLSEIPVKKKLTPRDFELVEGQLKTLGYIEHN